MRFLREALRVVRRNGRVVMLLNDEARASDFEEACARSGFTLRRVGGRHLFFEELTALPLPPTFVHELMIAGPEHSMKMKGSGLVVINPPWQLDRELAPMNPWLGEVLAQEPGGRASLRWLVPEK